MTIITPTPSYVTRVIEASRVTDKAVVAEALAAIEALREFAREYYPNVHTLHLEYSDQANWLTLEYGNLHDKEGAVRIEDRWFLAANISTNEDGDVRLPDEAWPTGFAPCDLCHGYGLALTVDV